MAEQAVGQKWAAIFFPTDYQQQLYSERQFGCFQILSIHKNIIHFFIVKVFARKGTEANFIQLIGKIQEKSFLWIIKVIRIFSNLNQGIHDVLRIFFG